MNWNIPYGRQHVTDEDIDAVVKTLKSDYLTQGPRVLEFERAFAEYVGCSYAVAVSNGTAALHLSVLSLDLNPDEKVITTPITFAASANCVRYCGGEVVFADIDPDTYLISLESCQRLLADSPHGTYKGIIPVDFAGLPVDMESFRDLANEYGLWLLEDACHAPGGSFMSSKGSSKCGSGEYADLAIFSFHPVKHIAAGEGGMITTNDENLYAKLQRLRTHGITKDPAELIENHGGWYYEMQDLGFNYRLTDFQCALAASQLNRANAGLKSRREIAERYDQAFNEVSVKTQSIPKGYEHAYHLYVIEVEDRLGLYNHLKANGIHAQVHYIPVHLLQYYKQLGHRKGDFPNAESYYEKCLSLPMYPTLTPEEQNYVIEKVKEFV